MEDEEGDMFYQNERDFFGEEEESFGLGRPEYPPFILPNPRSMEPEKKSEVEEEAESVPHGIRAYNPMDMVRQLPEHRQSEYLFMMSHNKRFSGIQHFFGMEAD